MAEVSGPTSSLPYSRHKLPEGATCDDCERVGLTTLAIIRMQGETDSFGAEYSDLCSLHLAQERINKIFHDLEMGYCEWCKKETQNKDLRYTKDIDEGSYGPVYEVCGNCRDEQNQALQEELESVVGWYSIY